MYWNLNTNSPSLNIFFVPLIVNQTVGWTIPAQKIGRYSITDDTEKYVTQVARISPSFSVQDKWICSGYKYPAEAMDNIDNNLNIINLFMILILLAFKLFFCYFNIIFYYESAIIIW